MRKCVIDVEANGLLDTVTKLWCAVAYDIETGEYFEFDLHNGDYTQFTAFMQDVDLFIGHNILGYDLEVIRRITGYEYKRNICDTLVMSRLYNPDRKLPDGCPKHIPDLEGKQKMVGAHGLEAWGYRVAQAKPHIDRWDEWHPRILHRCKEDVGINYKTLLALMEEAELSTIPMVTL